ncbi:PCNA [Hyphantria cunea nucleopolyhedrovirus]|uniref:PCNA n=1 Tax=Hyphantria cunea nuclear polyhedrosis virus TaxID=28288 RepID=Q8JXF7_NPVHC|nr:PCNA [Hyphantria cunea nucleopolyhedrovirus]BAC02931.1 proliferating cell nuclear antigen [Hyphantria cunea nucleopolyhedrovirus]BAE72392.1 PCNA [Hyphantria cunea nucleopolyhedrovirus]
MEVTFATAGSLKNIVDALRGLLTYATFDCNADGLHLQSMDSEHVALVDLRLKRAGFARYTCERKLSFSVPMRGLHKIVRAATTNKQLTMRASARDDQVHFAFKTAERTVTCALSQISLDVERLGVPDDDEYDCVLAVASDAWARVCSDLAQLDATVVELSSGAAGLCFAADAGDGVRANVLLRAAPRRPLTQAFACRYLNAFGQTAPLSKFVNVCMSANAPLRLRFCLERLGKLDLYLAPQVSSGAKDGQ